MEPLDGRFEETVELVGAGELEEGAEDLWGAERGGWGWEGGGVEVVDEGLEGEVGVGEVEGSGAGGWGQGAEVGGEVEVVGGVVGHFRPVVGESCGGGMGGAYAAGNGDAGVARGLGVHVATEGGGVCTVVCCGAFGEELDEVWAPATCEEMGVDGDSFAANGQKVHICEFAKAESHLTELFCGG